MSESVQFVWDDELTDYDFGPSHPLNPVRLDLTVRLARALGVLDLPNVTLVSPDIPDDDLIASVHARDYIEAVRRAAADPDRPNLRYGLGTEDNPCFPAMHEASARVVAGTVAVARAVWDGAAEHGVNIAGGLHHAMPANASGFCIYNDAAAGIRALLDAGAERVAYVDVDVHHGDGVQAVFWDDPRVLTISLHETPRTLFPGTGFPDEIGGPGAEGSVVNVALPPGTTDAGWHRAFDAVVPPLLRAWRPEILVTQHGCDTHMEDPLAHLALSVDGQREAYAALHKLAHEICDGRWIATGGGGYALADVVPRAWTHLIAVAVGATIDPATETPDTWRDYVSTKMNLSPPRRMTDGITLEYKEWGEGYDPADWLDRAVIATQKAVFAWHGINPDW